MSLQDRIEKKIQQAMAPVHLEVINDSHGHSRGQETHFTVIVVSDKFEGQSRVDRQRWVASLFEDERQDGLHALSQKTFTPAEWEKVKDTFVADPPACRGGGKN